MYTITHPETVKPQAGEYYRLIYQFTGGSPVDLNWYNAVALQVGNNPYLFSVGFTPYFDKMAVDVEIAQEVATITQPAYEVLSAILDSVRGFQMSADVAATLVTVMSVDVSETDNASRVAAITSTESATVWTSPRSIDGVDTTAPSVLDSILATITGTLSTVTSGVGKGVANVVNPIFTSPGVIIAVFVVALALIFWKKGGST